MQRDKQLTKMSRELSEAFNAHAKVTRRKLTLKELLQSWSFDWGMKYPCPYIWFGWWLITFDPDPLRSFWSYVSTIEIDFLPD